MSIAAYTTRGRLPVAVFLPRGKMIRLMLSVTVQGHLTDYYHLAFTDWKDVQVFFRLLIFWARMKEWKNDIFGGNKNEYARASGYDELQRENI